MPPVRAFVGLSAPAYARLLAALAEARGRTARAEGAVVTYGDGRRVRAVAARTAVGARRAAGDADALAPTRPAVADRLRGRVAVVGPAAVRRRLLYGLDRDRADRLARAHLGTGVEALCRPTDDRSPRAAPVAGVLVAALVALVAAAGAGVGGEPDPTPGLNEEGWVDSEPDGPTTLAPGLTRAGVVDAGALAAAHRTALARGAYEVDLQYREEFRRDRAFPRAARLRSVAVAGPNRYHETTRGWGDPVVAPVPTTRREAYAGAEGRYVRSGDPNATVARVTGGASDADPYAARGAAYVRRFLGATRTDVVDTRVEDGRVSHRVAVRGTDDPALGAYSATALVTGDGLVRQLQVSYVHVERDVAVSLTVRYDPGPVDAGRPEWVPANASTPTDDPRVGRYPD